MKFSRFIPAGKLDPEFLKPLLMEFSTIDDRIILGPRIGEDAAVIDMGDRCLVATTDPVTFVAEEIGLYTLHINANDIATRGAKPRWFLATMLFPADRTSEEMVESVFLQISRACRSLGISLVGGHTEVTDSVTRPVVVGQMLGEVEKDRLVMTSGARIGDDIVLTKGIAIEATSILAREKAGELKNHFPREFMDRCKGFLSDPGISILKEAEIAVRSVAVHAMHDPTEGGLATGLHEICDAADLGLCISGEKIHIYPETVKLCRHFHLDPLGVIASGALLICVSPDDSHTLVTALRKEGIDASVIGTLTEKHSGIQMEEVGQLRDVPIFERDEITRVL